jgi:hypothetical protein
VDNGLFRKILRKGKIEFDYVVSLVLNTYKIRPPNTEVRQDVFLAKVRLPYRPNFRRRKYKIV